MRVWSHRAGGGCRPPRGAAPPALGTPAGASSASRGLLASRTTGVLEGEATESGSGGCSSAAPATLEHRPCRRVAQEATAAPGGCKKRLSPEILLPEASAGPSGEVSSITTGTRNAASKRPHATIQSKENQAWAN